MRLIFKKKDAITELCLLLRCYHRVYIYAEVDPQRKKQLFC